MGETSSIDSSFFLNILSSVTHQVYFAFEPAGNKILFLNEAFEKVFLLSRESVMSDLSVLQPLIHAEDHSLINHAFSYIQKEKASQKMELRLNLAGTTEKWVRIHAWPFQADDKFIIIGIATDITTYKEYGDTLYKFANKKNSILDILSHDLVSPLGNIQMCVQILSKQLEPSGDEVAARMLSLITDNSTRSINMIRDLVNKEFLESSEAPLIMQRSDIIKRIQEIIEQYKTSYQTINQQVSLQSSAESLYVTLDETKFMQVINNLLSNALKFTRDTDSITVIVEEKGEKVLVQVKDTGIGIPAENQPYIFDKFTKARRPGIHGEPTTGLGLSIIKTIIEWHKGRIWFESSEATGTTFFIEIPKDQ